MLTGKRNTLKLIVLNRYEKQKPAVGFAKGFGLKNGGIAGTVAHDSHNVICLGTNDEVIFLLTEWLTQNKGGIAFSDGKKVFGLPLPIAGLMSNKSASFVANKYGMLDQMTKNAGSKLSAPFMTLSFLSLLVIPELKLSNYGLFYTSDFSYTSIYSE